MNIYKPSKAITKVCKPHACNNCEKSFTEQDELKVHRNSTNNKETCGKYKHAEMNNNEKMEENTCRKCRDNNTEKNYLKDNKMSEHCQNKCKIYEKFCKNQGN